MSVDAKTRRVIDAYRLRTDRLRNQLSRYLTVTWGALEDYRTPDIEAFAETVVPVVDGSLRQMTAMTDGYLAAVETTQTGKRVGPSGAPAVNTEALRGVPAETVYARGGTALWTALSEGKEFPDAWQIGLARLIDIGTTDLQLAKTHTSRSILSKKKEARFFRRVLEGKKSCGICILASTQRYKRGDLMPIHGGCDCSILPIFGEDPGRIIEPELLDSVDERIHERFGGIDDQTRKTADKTPRYQDVLITHEHGELGPILGVRGQHFTGPSDL